MSCPLRLSSSFPSPPRSRPINWKNIKSLCYTTLVASFTPSFSSRFPPSLRGIRPTQLVNNSKWFPAYKNVPARIIATPRGIIIANVKRIFPSLSLSTKGKHPRDYDRYIALYNTVSSDRIGHQSQLSSPSIEEEGKRKRRRRIDLSKSHWTRLVTRLVRLKKNTAIPPPFPSRCK